MAVYKIFPKKDTTLYSEYPTANAGLDEILELGYYTSLFDGKIKENRILIEFDTAEIAQLLIDQGITFQNATLKMKIANSISVPESFQILVNNIRSQWVNGTGKIADTPISTNGACWSFAGPEQILPWVTEAFPPNITASFQEGEEGGGDWYITPQVIKEYKLYDNLDLEINVSLLVSQSLSFIEATNGFIIRAAQSPLIPEIALKYFSSDTNTVYPPELEIKWDDFIYDTELEEIDTSLASIGISNIKGAYREDEKYRFRLNVRPQYPKRKFSTTSVYLDNLALPDNAVWSIQDYYTKETIIGFDNTYTKISCDNTSSYFDVYMKGLQPERYYQILIKVQIDGSTMIVPTNAIFKIQRDV